MLVSRVCHDLVSPVGAVMNGLEVLEDERDPAMRADALKLVESSAAQAAARLQFARLAFGAAGSAGAELDLNEVGRVVGGLLKGGKVELIWQAGSLNWPKDWAKLLTNATLLAADSLPRGGQVLVKTGADAGSAGISNSRDWPHGAGAGRDGEGGAGRTGRAVDSRSIQPYLMHRLARELNAGFTLTWTDSAVEIAAG